MNKFTVLFAISSICCLTVTCQSDIKDEHDVKGEFLYEEYVQAIMENMNMPRPVDSYDYPVYPGMKEWANFSTGEEMMEACQVPEPVLNKMSTQAVIQALLEHPLIFGAVGVFHRYQYQMDFGSAIKNNNAFKALSMRPDAGSCLLERLKLADPLAPMAVHPLELMMSQPVILLQFTESEKKTIVELTLNHHDLRQKEKINDHQVVAWLLAGRILAAGYTPFMEEAGRNESLRLFLDGETYVYMEEVYGDIPQYIINYAEKFIKQ
jgi:hypothetical protein